MSRYSNIAIKSVDDLKKDQSLTPMQAWANNAKYYYPEKISSQKKGCPKSTFLGLCEAGEIIGVRGGSYTRSKLNKQSGLKALALLRSQPKLSESELWSLISNKTHNQQMKVVKALFDHGYIQP